MKVLHKYRFLILFAMIFFSTVNAFRFLGELNNLYSVIAAHLYFGYGALSYVFGRDINMVPQGRISSSANPVLRGMVGVICFILYLMVFSFNGYGRDWF